jgi:hypothetical protein
LIVPSLQDSGLCSLTRHFRAGLQIVSSLRDWFVDFDDLRLSKNFRPEDDIDRVSDEDREPST